MGCGFIFAVLLGLWLVLAFVEAGRFIQYDGKTKRGLKVGASRLSSDMEHFLHHLSHDCFEDGTTAFIKKENRTVLIQPISGFFYRGFGIWYVGYVDLSQEEPRIEYRMPISTAVFLVPFATLLAGWIITAPREEVIQPILFAAFMAVLIPIAHATSKAKVRRFIRSMMSGHRG
jgi:hypothetical protein